MKNLVSDADDTNNSMPNYKLTLLNLHRLGTILLITWLRLKGCVA